MQGVDLEATSLGLRAEGDDLADVEVKRAADGFPDTAAETQFRAGSLSETCSERQPER